jgi:AIPR protein
MALVELFKQQLENESQAIANAKGLDKRGDFLIWWYFSKLRSLSEQTVEQIVCDGTNDQGIDAIWIDDESVVHFYNFKNPADMGDSFPGVEVDKIISGLQLIINRQHAAVTNQSLRDLIEDVLGIVPKAYRIHMVHRGTGFPGDGATKLDAFINSLGAPSPDFWSWSAEDISVLQTEFYTKTLPTVEETIEFELTQAPYQVRSADHDCYLFSLRGAELATVYEKYGETLLQQNIRIYQGDKGTNDVIRKTATGPESGNFFHFNNGVVFLAEAAKWDQFTRKLELRRFQVVNGGQTIRVLSGAHQKTHDLKPDVQVPVRIITSQGNKDFSNSVTVNLNNQNRIEPSFLRSNDPRVVQLVATLATKGWYLERRVDEVEALSLSEKAAIEAKIGHTLNGRVIRLKDGLQAYTATFLRQPEVAKKNPKKIFEGAQDGGLFDKVFNVDLTAEKVIAAHRLAIKVNEYVKQFMARKRKKDKVADWKAEYATLIGESLMSKHSAVVDQVVPQSAMFLMAAVYDEHVNVLNKPLDDLLATLERGDYEILNSKIEQLIDYTTKNAEGSKSWPTLLKSQTLFDNFGNFVRGKADAQPAQ